MIKRKGGFTLVEVSLFLAITGLLFLGVTIGVQNSIFQQRYNDSVQSFVEFLRTAYSKTENVQGTNKGGNSKKAIYGKLITFGEVKNLAGGPNDGEIFMYDVIGPARCEGGFNGALAALKKCGAEVIENGKLLGLAESYKPRWSAAIQTVDKKPFVGAVLITRHPQSGTIHTFSMFDKTVEVNSGARLNSFLENDSFSSDKAVNFCVNPYGYDNKDSGIRADVRVEKWARNSSGVEVMPDNENDCVNGG